MAYVNIHSLPGVTVSITYWAALTQVVTPANPLALAAGVYSLTGPQTEWDRAVFEITSFGTGVLPMNGRISVVDAEVAGPYGGHISIASGTTYASAIAQQTFSPDVPYTGSRAAAVSLTNRYFICGHNSGSGPDWLGLTSLVIELDGTFAVPDFWTDFDNSFELTTLQKPVLLVNVPGQAGQIYLPPSEYCTPDRPDPPGPGPGLGAPRPGGGSEAPPHSTSCVAHYTPTGEIITCCRTANSRVLCR